jgi:hypothetical protein
MRLGRQLLRDKDKVGHLQMLCRLFLNHHPYPVAQSRDNLGDIRQWLLQGVFLCAFKKYKESLPQIQALQILRKTATYPTSDFFNSPDIGAQVIPDFNVEDELTTDLSQLAIGAGVNNDYFARRYDDFGLELEEEARIREEHNNNPLMEIMKLGAEEFGTLPPGPVPWTPRTF